VSDHKVLAVLLGGGLDLFFCSAMVIFIDL